MNVNSMNMNNYQYNNNNNYKLTINDLTCGKLMKFLHIFLFVILSTIIKILIIKLLFFDKYNYNSIFILFAIFYIIFYIILIILGTIILFCIPVITTIIFFRYLTKSKLLINTILLLVYFCIYSNVFLIKFRKENLYIIIFFYSYFGTHLLLVIFYIINAYKLFCKKEKKIEEINEKTLNL